MISAICFPSSYAGHFRWNAMEKRAGRVAGLAALLLTLFMTIPQQAKAGTIYVDIYSGYDQSNAPTGGPYTGWAGQLALSCDLFSNPAGYSFGAPFGLSSFAAVISFTQYMSTTGYYSGGLNSFNSPVLWTKAAGAVNPFYGEPWAAGSAYNEILFNAGYNDFELVFLAGADFGGGLGGGPFNLSLTYFSPWGGDPRVTDGAYSFVTTRETPAVPESGKTVGLLTGALAVLLSLRRRLA